MTGHSSLNVSLTYFRGLEAAELNEEDMPMVKVKRSHKPLTWEEYWEKNVGKHNLADFI